MSELCPSCLSSDRQLKILAIEEREYLYNILNAAGLSVHAVPLSVCWECNARLRAATRFVIQSRKATSTLITHMPHQPLQSLSRLSKHTNTKFIEITYYDDTIVPNAVEQDNYDDDHFVDVNAHLDDGNVDDESKSVLEEKNAAFNDDFASSDDEPLTHAKRKIEKVLVDANATEKTVKKKKKKKKNRDKKAKTKIKSEENEEVSSSSSAIRCVVLTWEQVENERQSRLCQLTSSLRCERCAVGFNHTDKLQRHMDKHDPSRGQFECTCCGVYCSTRHALAAHRRRHTVRWQCVECGALWSRAGVAADHVARDHGTKLDGLVKHICSVCGHRAESLRSLRHHVSTHRARVTCPHPHCHKTLRDNASLRTHLFIHRGSKEHECPDCGKKFLFKKAMQLHRDTHTKAATLYCHKCDVCFKSRMSYYQHIRYSLAHIHPDLLKHECDVCGARFVRSARLLEHRAAKHDHTHIAHCTHTGCDFSCASLGVLRAHRRRVHRPHTTTPAAHRARVCHRCGKAYTTKKSLEVHLRSHDEGKCERTEKKMEAALMTSSTDPANIDRNEK